MSAQLPPPDRAKQPVRSEALSRNDCAEANTSTADAERANRIGEAMSTQRRRTAKRRGVIAEQLVANRLAWCGYKCVEIVATPKAVVRGKTIYQAKVSGDIKAVEPGTGKAVLVEVKQRPQRLRYSDLAPHQVRALSEYAQHGAIAILAWVNDGGVVLMRWPLATSFATGSPLTIEQARAIDFQPERRTRGPG